LASYLRPTRLQDALAALAAQPRIVLAGGTDHYPARALHEPDEDILDLSAINGLRAIEAEADRWRIPALATWTDVIEAPLPPLFDGLKQAARQVGGVQVQNMGTLAGNVCNASPAADGIPALLALDAGVELAGIGGTRVLPLAEFVVGPRRTARRADEIVTALLIPRSDARSQFFKLGGRAYLVISISMVAVTLAADAAGRVTHAAIAVGACGPLARRLPALEAALLGQVPAAGLVRPDHLAPLSPIDDVRASAAYRLQATLELLRRGLSAPMRAAA
jgi:CO/xanthine dehydrogenase FAD-binding subunit